MKHCLCKFILLITSIAFSPFIFAKEINLYEQPKADAKVIEKIDLAAGIIPIYTPDQSEWVKVADPRNGNVGWIKTNDLNNAGTAVTFTQRIFDEGKGPHTYQMIEYGQPQKLTPQQVQNLQKMQIQQRALQESLQNAVQQMMDQINQLSQGTLNFNPSNTPLIMPIVIVPQEKNATKSQVGPTTKPDTKPAMPLTKPSKTP